MKFNIHLNIWPCNSIRKLPKKSGNLFQMKEWVPHSQHNPNLRTGQMFLNRRMDKQILVCLYNPILVTVEGIFKNVYFIWRTGRNSKRGSILCSIPQMPATAGPALTQDGNSVQISCVEDGQSAWAIICCLLRCAFAGRWSWKQCCDSDTGTPYGVWA